MSEKWNILYPKKDLYDMSQCMMEMFWLNNRKAMVIGGLQTPL